MTADPRPCACGRPGCVLVRRYGEAKKDWARRKFASYSCRNHGMRGRYLDGIDRACEAKRARRRARMPASPAEWARHPAAAPLTAEQREFLEPYIVRRATTVHLADMTGLPAAAIAAYRLERGQRIRANRKAAHRSGTGAIEGDTDDQKARRCDLRFREAIAAAKLRRPQEVDQVTLWREWVGIAA